MRSLQVEPVRLAGRFVRLEPLAFEHAPDLRTHCDEEIHQYFVTTRPLSTSPREIEAYVQRRIEMENQISFAVIWLATGEAIGCTSYLDIRPSQLGLEIGMTWYGRAYQGGPVNPECKLLLLEHAFEVLHCERVQLKTDGRNLHSQRAIEKLGAKKEGVLRRHRHMPGGIMSDTVMYSIIPEEWPLVRIGLESRLASFESPVDSILHQLDR